MSLCAKFHTFVPICAMVQLTALTNMYSEVPSQSPEKSQFHGCEPERGFSNLCEFEEGLTI